MHGELPGTKKVASSPTLRYEDRLLLLLLLLLLLIRLLLLRLLLLLLLPLLLLLLLLLLLQYCYCGCLVAPVLLCLASPFSSRLRASARWVDAIGRREQSGVDCIERQHTRVFTYIPHVV